MRTNQAGDAIKYRGFSGSGWAEQNGNTRRHIKGRIEHEGRSARTVAFEMNTDGEIRRDYRDDHADQIRGPKRRFSPYTMESVTKEKANNTTAMRFASEYSSDCT